MPFCIHRLPKAICEHERQTTDFSISYRHGIVGEAVLISNHVVQGYLTGYPPDDVAAPVGSMAS